MDKKGVGMAYKKYIMLCALLLSLNLLAGCETVKGIAKGVSEGAGKDAQGFGSTVMAADDWIRKNLW